MKTITTLAAVLFAATSAFALPASAQYRGDNHHDSRERHGSRQERHERREVRHEPGDDRRDARHERRDDRHFSVVQQPRRYAGYERYDRHDPSRRYYASRTYRPAHAYVAPRGHRYARWNVGHRMPPPFYARPYYIDPLAYQLRMPPRGYRWVRVDRDVYMVSVASGLIADVLYGIFR